MRLSDERITNSPFNVTRFAHLLFTWFKNALLAATGQPRTSRFWSCGASRALEISKPNAIGLLLGRNND